MRLIRLVILVSYVFWGGLGLYSLGELLLRNVWGDLFSVKTATPIWIDYERKGDGLISIQYEFQVDGKTYKGERRVADWIIEERLPKKKSEIQISYNRMIPQVNFIEELGMKMKNGYVGLAMAGFFIALTFLFDVLGDKQRWADRYQKALK
jgi:hypothetical protein